LSRKNCLVLNLDASIISKRESKGSDNLEISSELVEIKINLAKLTSLLNNSVFCWESKIGSRVSSSGPHLLRFLNQIMG
jgi:hypothetical protein